MHYNGHGTVPSKEDGKYREDAGAWCCADNKYIHIEEVLSTISKALAPAKEHKIGVRIIADCAGAGGAFHRCVSKLNDNSLKLNKRISNIDFRLACDWNEVSFGGERGGLLTYHTETAEGQTWNESHNLKKNDFYDVPEDVDDRANNAVKAGGVIVNRTLLKKEVEVVIKTEPKEEPEKV